MKLDAEIISSVSSAMSSTLSDEEEDSEEDSEDDDVPEYKGEGRDDDDYIDEAAPEVDDDEGSFIMELAVPTPIASAPQKTLVQTTGLTPAAISIPTPASAPAPVPAPTPAPVVIGTPSKDIRILLDAFGEAVLRCSLDHTPATAAKLEDNIAEAFQAVVEFHKTTILEVEQTSSKSDIELARRLQVADTERQNLRVEIVNKSKEIKEKDEEAERKELVLDQTRVHFMRREMRLQAHLSKIEKETVAKRKRVEESISKASKKANV